MRISDWSSDVCSSDLTHRVIYVRRLCWLATRWRMTTVETIGRIRRAFRAEAIGAGDCASAPCVAQDRAQGDRGRRRHIHLHAGCGAQAEAGGHRGRAGAVPGGKRAKAAPRTVEAGPLQLEM